jgi:4-aminobutyrate aminotransferase-like enzyme
MSAFDVPNNSLCNKLKALAYDNNLLIISCGESSIRLRPPLDINKSHMDEFINIIYKCFTQLQSISE